MAAVDARLPAGQLARRDNWASREAGVIVVFCIVFIVAVGLLAVCITRLVKKRKAARQPKY